MRIYLILIATILIFSACTHENHECSNSFSFPLHETGMICNIECSNLTDGNPIIIQKTSGDTIFLENSNCLHLLSDKWIAGWGNNERLYDAGVENLAIITKINSNKSYIILGKQLRGKIKPQVGKHIVFWNTQPSGFSSLQNKEVVSPSIFNSFNGKSAIFTKIFNHEEKYFMLVVENDTNTSSTFLASSTNLLKWKAEKQGDPIIHYNSNLPDWCKNPSGLAPIPTDLITVNNHSYLILVGKNIDLIQRIGLAEWYNFPKGKIQILDDPIIIPDKDYDSKGCGFAKICSYHNQLILYYDAINLNNTENICMAAANNIHNWNKSSKNPVITAHNGWRSAHFTSEPAWLQVHNDSIFLILSGAKSFKDSYWDRKITGKAYKDKPGNIDDAQLGVFVSVDSEHFCQHINNPVFCNNYSLSTENEHMGPGLKFIEKKDTTYMLYFAKSSSTEWKYNILIRYSVKN